MTHAQDQFSEACRNNLRLRADIQENQIETEEIPDSSHLVAALFADVFRGLRPDRRHVTRDRRG
jgi:hypothetical protein